jgi:hypothetical protein
VNERLVGELMRELVVTQPPPSEDDLLLHALAVDRAELAPIDEIHHHWLDLNGGD